MDALFFLTERTGFIRRFYTEGAKGFLEIKHRIDAKLPPYVDLPSYGEGGDDPPYLTEWLEADASIDVLGMACISMLSDTLKIYFRTLEERVIRFSFKSREAAFKKGFLSAYLGALVEILDTDWSDCPADLGLIEQIILVRNRAQHGEDLSSFVITHDRATLDKYPRPFFIRDNEISAATAEDGSLGSLLMPTIKVDGAGLERAIGEVEKLGEWIDGREAEVAKWRARKREVRSVQIDGNAQALARRRRRSVRRGSSLSSGTA